MLDGFYMPSTDRVAMCFVISLFQFFQGFSLFILVTSCYLQCIYNKYIYLYWKKQFIVI